MDNKDELKQKALNRLFKLLEAKSEQVQLGAVKEALRYFGEASERDLMEQSRETKWFKE